MEGFLEGKHQSQPSEGGCLACPLLYGHSGPESETEEQRICGSPLTFSEHAQYQTSSRVCETGRIAYVPGCPRPQPRLELTSWGFCRVSTNMGIYDLGYFFVSFDFVLIFILLGVGGM